MKKEGSDKRPEDATHPAEGVEGVSLPADEGGAGAEGDLNRRGEQGGRAGGGQVRPYQESPRNPMDHGGIAD